MIHTENLNSATKIFKDMLKKGWKIFSQVRQDKTFKVVLKKIFKIHKKILEDTKTIFVGYWAIPKAIKVKDQPNHGSNRKGVYKIAQMCRT